MPNDVAPKDLPLSETGRRPPPPRAPSHAPRVLTGRAVLFMLLAFFLVTSSVNAVMITFALRTMPGVSVKNAYEASQAFNTEALRIAQQDALGLQLDVARASIRSEGQFLLSLRDKQGNPVSNLEAQIRIGRPVDQKFDRTLALAVQGAGRYSAPLPVLPLGQWDVVIEVLRGKDIVHRAHERVVINQ